MLFENQDSSLRLDIASYECPADSGDITDRNWLVLRAVWRTEDDLRKDSNSCLLTYELQGMAAGLKVLRAGIRSSYESDFESPYFSLSARSAGEGIFQLAVSFYLPNTMDGDDTAELTCTLDTAALTALTEELDRLCAKFPERP